MKALTDYPTPEFDAALALANDPDGAPEVCDLCESLERRLAACREVLEEFSLNFGENEKQARAEFGTYAIDRELRLRAALSLTKPLANLKE